MAEEWLAGVYRGELVTAKEGYRTGLWDRLPELRTGKFLGFNTKRNKLAPYFFFLKQAAGATRLADINAGARPRDYGLHEAAYESMGDGTGKNPACAIPAKGKRKKNGFAVQGDIAAKIPEEGIAALAMLDGSNEHATTRTGTFFRYNAEKNGVLFTPLEYRGRYLSGKGILAGAWGLDNNMWGGMNRYQYLKERHCPLNIGSAYFKKGGYGFYATYRSVATDLRMDMPLTYLHLAKVGGFGHLARNMGESLNKPFGRHMDRIFLRDLLADGERVDYEDINASAGLNFDITADKELLRQLACDLFKVLYLCAVASDFRAEGLIIALKEKNAPTEFLEFNKRNFMQISGTYGKLSREFLGGLEKRNLQHFAGETEGLAAINDMPRLFKEVTGKDVLG